MDLVRFLTEDANVWSQNAWDHVPPPDDQAETIAASLARQRSTPVPDEEKNKYNDRPQRHWDTFYKNNTGNFFRDRKWLHNEFSELVAATQANAGEVHICEIGCGAGNSVFPLLSANKNPKLNLHAFDYSAQAVKLVQTNPLYISPPVGKVEAAVWDLSSSSLPPGIQPETVDIVILVFVLSALHPEEWKQAIENIRTILKPGGLAVLRDYGRYDLTQLRFKTGRLLEENFYIRGDKTRVYFFELDELAILFSGSRAPSSITTQVTHVVSETDQGSETVDEVTSTSPTSSDNIHPILKHYPATPRFSIEQLGIDRRLIVNRKRQLKMYRVWMQGKFQKRNISIPGPGPEVDATL